MQLSLKNPSFDRHDESFLDKFVSASLSTRPQDIITQRKTRQFVTDMQVKNAAGEFNFDMYYVVETDKNVLTEHYVLKQNDNVALMATSCNTTFRAAVLQSLYDKSHKYFGTHELVPLIPTDLPTLISLCKEHRIGKALFILNQLLGLCRSYGDDAEIIAQCPLGQEYVIVQLCADKTSQAGVTNIFIISLKE